jgi:membrane-associated protease RseP (regulator of RpoE activity)
MEERHMNYRYSMLIISAFMLAASLSLPGKAQDTRESERRVEIIRLSDHPWLGVRVSDVSPQVVDTTKQPREKGAYVVEVESDSPADSAGILAGDVIVGFGDREIYGAGELVSAVRGTEVGEAVRVVIVRDGRQRDLTVTVRERPRRRAVRIPHPPDAPRIMMAHRHGRLGVSVINLSDQLAEYFKVPDGKGVLVEKVHENTPAERADLRAGDVIVKINDREIDTASRLRRVLSTYDAGEDIRIETIREGSRRTISVQLEERSMSEFYLPDFEVPHFDSEEFEVRIFGPGGKEEFKRNIEESIRPGMEDLKIQMDQLRERLQDMRIEIPEHYRNAARTRRV